jgi:hypothetical protein
MLAILPVLSIFPAVAWPAPERITAEQLLELAPFNEHLKELKAGKIVAVGLSDVNSDTELKVLMSILVPASLDDAVAVLQAQSKLNGVLSVKEIESAAPDSQLNAVFGRVAYTPEEMDEVRRLLKVSPESEFNFSSEEIAMVRKKAEAVGEDEASDDKAMKAMSAAMADVLKGRYLAYRKQGLDGVAAYKAGGSEPANPALELVLATESMQMMEDQNPQYYNCLRFYPQSCDPEIHQQFFWIKQREAGRPMFSLKHWLIYVKPEYAVITERQFYLNHSLNSLQVVIGFLKHPDGTLVVLLNTVFTEKVNVGIAKGIADAIGRKQVEKRVRPMFEHLRAAFAKKK